MASRQPITWLVEFSKYCSSFLQKNECGGRTAHFLHVLDRVFIFPSFPLIFYIVARVRLRKILHIFSSSVKHSFFSPCFKRIFAFFVTWVCTPPPPSFCKIIIRSSVVEPPPFLTAPAPGLPTLLEKFWLI